MTTTFNPCFDLPQDPFTEKRKFCNLQLGEKRLLKMDQVQCHRAKRDGEKGYLCKDRFFPESFGYFPTLNEKQRGVLFFGDGTEIRNILLPVSPLEKAAELLDFVPLQAAFGIKLGRFEKILILIDSVPDSRKKDKLLQTVAFKAREGKLFDQAIEIARKISDPEFRIITLGKVVSCSDYQSLNPKNNPTDILNAAWDLSDEIPMKADRNFVRLKILEFQSASGLFYEAFAFAFLIRNHEARGKARVAIATRWLAKEPASKVPSWLLDLAEADDYQSKAASGSLLEEIRSLRKKPGFVEFPLQKKADRYHKSNLESVANAYNEATRFPWAIQDALKGSLQKVIDRMGKKKIRKPDLQP